jgi:prolyl-tRNA editing enzyme YbaK/EbsC (Cys-tRNA(Pro) deacylase)
MRSHSVTAVESTESPRPLLSSDAPPPPSPGGPPALSPSAQRVQDALRALGFTYEVTESAQATRTAAEAARAVGCEVGQIAKALVFRTAQSGRAVLVIASGANKVNEWRIGVLLKEALDKASAAFVREHAGFTIGGVPPVGHARPLETFIDEDLLSHEAIWAAAGTPNALFRLAPADLVKMTGGRVVKVK